MRNLVLALILVLPVIARAAAGEEIEEAKPVEPPAEVPVLSPAETEQALRTRGYALLEWSNLIPDSRQLKTTDQSLTELNASGSWTSAQGMRWFGDVTGTYRFRAEEGSAMLNQAGVRDHIESWEWMVGKERARKSPGMMLSPSDFLFSSDNLPGLREQREGVWMVRASWQVPGQSFDVIYLHNLAVDEHGLPDPDITRRGGAARYFYQSNAFDAALNIADIEGDRAAGGWLQTYVFKTTKLYLDAAWREADHVLSQSVRNSARVLAGASYEGERSGFFRLEVYANNRGLDGRLSPLPSPDPGDVLETIFYRQWYAIASMQWSDLWRESAFTLNHIRALEYPEWLWMLRYEIPLTRHQAIGTTLARFDGLVTMPDATLATLDWKYTF